jgi:hypothetical protein
MKKIFAGIAFLVMASLLVPGVGLAGKKAQDGDQDGTPDRDRLKDGSCNDLVQPNTTWLFVAGKKAKTGDQDGTPDRDRLKDGSCNDLIQPNNNTWLFAAGKKTGDQDGTPDLDRLRDGSCLDG